MENNLLSRLVEDFKFQYSDLLDENTVGGIVSIILVIETEPVLYIEIGSVKYDWMLGIIPKTFRGVTINKQVKV